VRSPSHAELAAIHARKPTLAAHDAGHIVDWVKRQDNYPMRVRVILAGLMRCHSRSIQTTLETINTAGVPIDLLPLFDAIAVLDSYAHTLANYCNLCGHEDTDTLMYMIEKGAGIDPAFYIEAAQHV
jgi:hypothetical protein